LPQKQVGHLHLLAPGLKIMDNDQDRDQPQEPKGLEIRQLHSLFSISSLSFTTETQRSQRFFIFTFWNSFQNLKTVVLREPKGKFNLLCEAE
jgi:hypothetical protein